MPLEVILYDEWSKFVLVLPSKLQTTALAKLGSILNASGMLLCFFFSVPHCHYMYGV